MPREIEGYNPLLASELHISVMDRVLLGGSDGEVYFLRFTTGVYEKRVAAYKAAGQEFPPSLAEFQSIVLNDFKVYLEEHNIKKDSKDVRDALNTFFLGKNYVFTGGKTYEFQSMDTLDVAEIKTPESVGIDVDDFDKIDSSTGN